MQRSTLALIAGGVVLVVLLPIVLILTMLFSERRERGTQSPEPEPVCEAMKEVACVGPAVIGVTAASISVPTTVDNLGNLGNLSDKALVIHVAVQNTTRDAKLEFTGFTEAKAALMDNQGRAYSRVRLRKNHRFYGAVATTQHIRPGEECEDVLVFDDPINPAIESLSLELSLSAVGERGNARFRIPAEPLFAKPSPPEVKPASKPIIKPGPVIPGSGKKPKQHTPQG